MAVVISKTMVVVITEGMIIKAGRETITTAKVEGIEIDLREILNQGMVVTVEI